MVKFMVLSAPRSASTWVSNWLTTERTLCLHDPVLEHAPELLDEIPCARTLGLACTGLALLPDFVNTHPARKVIVHRELAEANDSLVSIGLSPLSHRWDHALEDLEGLHIVYEDLFDAMAARPIYEFLTGQAFDAERHQLLCAMHVEPNFERLRIVPERARDFRRRISEALV